MTAVAIAATPSRARTGWMLPTLVILVVTGIAQWAAAPYTVGVFHDDGVYALLARSIASGEGFHHSHLAGAPAATHYPPLYPLLLAIGLGAALNNARPEAPTIDIQDSPSKEKAEQIAKHLRSEHPNIWVAHPVEALWASYSGEKV